MKVIIAGSRPITDYSLLTKAIEESKFQITEVVSGGAAGPDTMGERWAAEHQIPVKRFLPDWNEWGRSAGLWRNIEMADYGEALIALWDGKSKGTGHMIKEVQRKGLSCYVVGADGAPAAMP